MDDNSMNLFKNHFENNKNELGKRQINNQSILKCISKNWQVFVSVDTAADFLKNNPWTPAAQFMHQCLFYDYNLFLGFLAQFEMHIINIHDKALILPISISKDTIAKYKQCYIFSGNFLNSLDSNKRVCYFGGLSNAEFSIKIMWTACNNYDEIKNENNESPVWVKIIIYKNTNTEALGKWVDEIVAEMDEIHFAVYNGSQWVDTFVKHQDKIMCHFLDCKIAALDPLSNNLKQIIFSEIKQTNVIGKCVENILLRMTNAVMRREILEYIKMQRMILSQNGYCKC